MRIVKSKPIRNVLISLKFNRIFNNFDGDTNHWSDFSHNIFTHWFGSITVPFVALSVLYDSRLSFVNNFSLVDSLLKHFIRIVFNFLCWRFDDFLLSLLDDIFIGSKIGRKFLFDHFSWLDSELLYFVVKRCNQCLKCLKYLPYYILLLELLFDERLL